MWQMARPQLFISTARPYKCTTIIARVCSVIFSSIFSTSILYVFISGSTKTGVQPFSVIARIVAMYVFAGTIISSPGAKSYARIINVNASKPFATPRQYLVPQYLAKFSANVSFSSPSKYQPRSKTDAMRASISSLPNQEILSFIPRCIILYFSLFFVIVV